MNNQSSRQSFCRHRDAIDMESQMKITQDFQGVDPHFELSLFVSEHSGARAYSRKKFPRPNWPRKFNSLRGKGLPGLISKCNRAWKQQAATQND
jgi:hypothetical protein